MSGVDVEHSRVRRNQDSISIIAIRDKSTRNLLRGLLNAGTEKVAKRTLERLRRECTPADASVVFRILRELEGSHYIAQSANFPFDAGAVERVPFFGTASLPIELCGLKLRLKEDEDRTLKAIEALCRVNTAILSRDRDAVSRALVEYTEHYGISLLLAQKAISVRHSCGFEGEKRYDHGEVLAPFLSPRRNVIVVAFEDSVDEGRDYTRVRRAFLDLVKQNQLSACDGVIVGDLFGANIDNEATLAQRAQAYARWGVVDAIAFLFRMRQLSVRREMHDHVEQIDAVVPVRIAEKWQSAFESINPQLLLSAIGANNQFFERTFFAHLPAWSEYNNLYDYRVLIEDAMSYRLNGQFPVPQKNASIVAAPQRDIQSLLASAPPQLSIKQVVPKNCGAFHRTIALISSVESGGIGKLDGKELSLLLDQTFDVASMLSLEELMSMMPQRSDDHLYSLLRAAVINDVEESKVTHHALRRSIQRVVQEDFDSDFVALLKHVDTERSHVSKYLYDLCTEAFLTELYDLFETTDEITEAHTSILEWWGERANDDEARIRAKSHRLTLRLRKVRGAIEETRIYVDPLRFISWIQEEQSAELRALSINANVILSDDNRAVGFDNQVRMLVEPRMRLLALFNNCYKEFCTNKLYGVTSFIGRRIRHGTLHGHLVLEIKPTIEAAIEEFSFTAPSFSEFLAAWFYRFDKAVHVMAADLMHVRSREKMQGLIIASIDEQGKVPIVNRMVEDIAKHMHKAPQLTQCASLIHEYCWLLFEIDLQRTRNAVEAMRREFVINVDEFNVDRAEIDRHINDRIRNLNALIQQKFDIVRSWFTRPTNQSPSASVALLFEAVQDEVRQRFPNFNPKLDTRGKGEFDLIGHSFHFFYDALFILIGNAAKHGQPDGVLGIEISPPVAKDKYSYLTVSVSSALMESNREECKSRIEEAMSAEIGDAMMRNQNSGIRKLRQMVEDVDEIIGFDHWYSQSLVTFRIQTRFIRA